MEVEAKFSFRTAEAFARWLGLERLGRFALRHPRAQTVVDTYLDTPAFNCLRGGFACRIRRHTGGATATLKSLADRGAPSAQSVRRRDELEVDLTVDADVRPAEGGALPDAWLRPALWPESDARTLAERLVGDAPLRRLATIRQERHEREIRDGARLIGTLSLDRVQFDRAQPELYELEAELAPGGSEADLAAIVAALQREPDFQPQARSKLARALDGLPGVPPLGREAEAPQASLNPQPGDMAAAEAIALRLLVALVPDPVENAALTPLLRRIVRVRAGHGDASLRAALAILRLAEGAAGRRRKALLAAIDCDAALRTLPAEARRRGLQLAALAAAAEQVSTLERAGDRLTTISSTERDTVLRVCGDRPNGEAGEAASAARVLWRAAFGRRLRVHPSDRPRAAVGLSFDASLAVTGRRLMAAQFDVIRRLEAALRDGAPVEAVHDARVAARRLRTTLRLFRRAYLSHDVRRVDAGLRRLDDALSAVRNLDVMLALLQEQPRDGSPVEAEMEALRREWSSARQRCADALAAQLDDPAHRAWCERTAAFLAGNAATERGAEPLYERAPAMIWQQYGVVRAAAQNLPEASLSELHDLRKEVRRLRYLLEGLHELLGSRSRKLVAACVRLQDALGALHDADQLREELGRHLHGDRSTAGPGTSGVQERCDQIAAALPALRRSAEAAWPKVGGRAFRRRLGRTVAAL